MPIDRVAALKNADALLQQGKLTQAIAEYASLVDDNPRDWNTANLLGDLYVRAGNTDLAVEQFLRSADRLQRAGFNAKAAALYKKILKLRPDDEQAMVRSGELAAAQGRLADAREQFGAVGDRRRARGDERGAAEISVRLGALDADDLGARLTGARARLTLDDALGAVRELKAIASDLADTEREADAIAVLREALQLAPADAEIKERLIAMYVALGDVEGVTELEAAEDPADVGQLLPTAAALVQAGRVDEGLGIARSLVAVDAARERDVVTAAAALGRASAQAGFCLAEVAVDAAVSRGDWEAAAAALRLFLESVPHHVPALLRLVDLYADAHLEAPRHAAELRLADAYLAAGSAVEALFIAEDLIARDAADPANREALRRALVLNGEPDPDSVIARRTGGRSAVHDVESRAFALGANAVDIDGILSDLTARSEEPIASDVPKDLDHVFAEIRAEATARTGQTHGEEQYLRGVALYESGMLEEAVGPLTAAAREEQFLFRAAALLGRVYKRREMPADAVDWFERAAEAPAPSAVDEQEVLYELAELLESSGENSRALAIYLEINAEAAGFRDVAERIARLTPAQGEGGVR